MGVLSPSAYSLLGVAVLPPFQYSALSGRWEAERNPPLRSIPRQAPQ